MEAIITNQLIEVTKSLINESKQIRAFPTKSSPVKVKEFVRTVRHPNKYTVFEDQRDIPAYGFESIAVNLPIDEACQWFEGKFGVLAGFESYTTQLHHVEADIIVHNTKYGEQESLDYYRADEIVFHTTRSNAAVKVVSALIIVAIFVMFACLIAYTALNK